jgi:hypothetical protein
LFRLGVDVLARSRVTLCDTTGEASHSDIPALSA